MLRLYVGEFLWAVFPPLLLLVFYYYRIPSAPSLVRVVLFFIFGIISGFFALQLEWVFETVADWVVDWQKMGRSLEGSALRQFLEVSPIEEGCKLAAVIVPSCYFQRRYRLRPSTVFLFTIAVALGFTAEENWVYLFYDTALPLDRLISTPVHVLFSAPWGYALGISISSHWSYISFNPDKKLVPKAWFNSVICHALANILSISGGYLPPVNYMSYGLFPFLLWMFWRLEQLLLILQGKSPITLITGSTRCHRCWQKGLVLFILLLGGNSIFGLFLLAKTVTSLSSLHLFQPSVLWFILSRLLLNLFFGFLAWKIYRYLRRLPHRRFF